MSEQDNPYAAPQADFDEHGEEAGPVRMPWLNGRIGRCRFVVYSMLGTIFIGPLLAVAVTPLVAALNNPFLFALAVPAFFVPALVMVRRRLHDLDASGWMMLLLIPFMFVSWTALMALGALALIPGAGVATRYGPVPEPHSMLFKVVALPLCLAALGWWLYHNHLFR